MMPSTSLTLNNDFANFNLNAMQGMQQPQMGYPPNMGQQQPQMGNTQNMGQQQPLMQMQNMGQQPMMENTMSGLQQ